MRQIAANLKGLQHLWLLLVICTTQIKISAQERDLPPPPPVRAAFTVFDGKKINVYSSRPDGSDRKLLISEETELTNARAFDAIRATISPAGNSIAYMVPARTGWSPIYVIDSDGRNKRKVLDKAIDFYWTPDGKNILYTLLSPRRPVGVGMSFWADGDDWYLLYLETGESERVASAEDKFHYLSSWVNNTVAIFGSNSLFSSWFFVYDVKTKKKLKSTEGPSGISNGSRTRRVGIASSRDPGRTSSPGIYESTPKLRKKSRLVSCHNHQCENVMWNGDEEIIFNKSTGPKGRIDITEMGESGYYVLFSIYKYNLQSRKESVIIRSSGKEVYRLEGVLENRAIIVSNESAPRTPRYMLESRDLGGKLLHTLFTSDKEMWFVGWLR